MPKVTNFNQTPDLPKLEEEVQKFWEENQTFQKSIEMRPKENSFTFYDGPPFATGLPHYGHLLASTMKDIIPRYQTMKGRRVERKWGWDCHGLPIENIAEKELGITRKKEIEELGVEKFNEVCRSKVLSYVEEWKKTIKRLGRWADMENDYKTMDLDFMESVWWVFKTLHDKGLIYEDHRSMHICPRCETTLSQSEVAEGYRDVKDISVTAEFELKNPGAKLDKKIVATKKVFILTWTTTPWTLPGNFLLAVNPKMIYVLFKGEEEGNLYIVAQDRLESVVEESNFEVVEKFSGTELVGLHYAPLFPYFKNTDNAFRVVGADFVSGENGTGIVHIAPGFGDDDYKVGKKENVELIQHVGMDGRMVSAVTDFAGREVKPKNNPQETDIEIIKYLAHADRLWSKKKITHSYSHCWRCDTPLLNYATSSYFVNVLKIKEQLLENAEDINWSPAHIKNGRWGNWLKGARDWSISRQRFWASVIPLWKCKCGQEKVYGSVAELEKDSGQKIVDLHKHIVDKITVPCVQCGERMKRIPDVLDTWFDSGSMPYGQKHYPFENKEEFEKNFPADFIGEGDDQTRAWFYYLHVISGGIKNSKAFKNVIVNGIVLAEDGKKMAKKLQNYPNPTLLINEYGADSLRIYLASSTVLKAENLNFREREIADLRRKVFVIWWNVFSFYKNFTDLEVDFLAIPDAPKHVLDRWLLSRLTTLVTQVTTSMDGYDIVTATRNLIAFISDLSNWYLRLSRNRLKNNPQASQVLGHVLYTLAQLFAPFAPFFSEIIHQNMRDEMTSVHHTDWPKYKKYKELLDHTLEKEMLIANKIAELGHASRRKNQLKVRQPLANIEVTVKKLKFAQELGKLIAGELNIKSVSWVESETSEPTITLDLELTSELKIEGEARELMRDIQRLRKVAGLQIEDQVRVEAPAWPENWQEKIEKHTNSKLVKGLVLKII